MTLCNTLNVRLVAIHMEGTRSTSNFVPQAGARIKEGDLLVLLGENRDLDRLREIVKNPQRA